MLIVVIAGLWIANVFSNINEKLGSPLPRYNKAEVEEVVTDTTTIITEEIVIQ